MAIKISGTTVIDDSRILQNVLAASSGSGAGSTLLSAGSFVASASQQGGRNYETHDFNSYPNLYSAVFINSSTSTNVPSGLTGNAYRFIMGAGDTTSRGFDLVGTAEPGLWFRARENANTVWRKVLTTSDGTFTGRLLRAPRVLTSGTSYTTPAGCTGIYVECVGAGGGQIALSFSRAAGGGGAGAYCARYFTVSPSTAYTYAIGAGTTGTGGSTTFTVGATTITAGGGAIGDNTTSGAPSGGIGGTATNGEINVSGTAGGSGYAISGSLVQGPGAGSFFGGGGNPPGYGGGVTSNFSATNGGQGVIRIWEFA